LLYFILKVQPVQQKILTKKHYNETKTSVKCSLFLKTIFSLSDKNKKERKLTKCFQKSNKKANYVLDNDFK